MKAQGDLLTNRLAYSIAEFCQVSGLGRSSVYELIRSGRLAVRKIGSRTLILRIDAEKFLLSLPSNISSDRQIASLVART